MEPVDGALSWGMDGILLVFGVIVQRPMGQNAQQFG